MSYVVANPASEARVGMFRLGFTNHQPSPTIDERAQPASIETVLQTALRFCRTAVPAGSHQLNDTYLYLKHYRSTLAT